MDKKIGDFIMKTGKFGIKLWVFAVVAFAFAAFELYLGLIAAFAFAILLEKDKWLNKQVILAILLFVLYNFAIIALDWTIGGLAKLLVLANALRAARIVNDITGIIQDIIYVLYIAINVLAIIRCFMGKDGIPAFVKVVDKVLDAAMPSSETEAQAPEESEEIGG
jgi:hypothetical protein